MNHIITRQAYKSALAPVAFYLLIALLLFAPLIKGGNRPVPLMVLELASLPLWATLVWRFDSVTQLPKLLLIALALFALYPLLQWLPMPSALLGWLPGRELYHEATVSAASSFSIVPQATFASWLSILPPLAVLLVTMNLKEDPLKRVVYVFLGIALMQAILALLQFGGGSHTAFRLTPTDFGEGIGTYVNRNHLAGMLEMALPISLGLLAASIDWRFQPDSIGLFVNHAHNDYIEYVFEAGIVAIVVMSLLLVAYVLRWPGLLRHEHWSRLTFMQVGAGIGLFVMALHGLTDYNLHIPANAIYFAFLAGVFFHRSVGRRTQREEEESPTTALQNSLPALEEPRPPAPRVVIPNPFSE